MNDPSKEELPLSEQELDEFYDKILREDDDPSVEKEVAGARAALDMIERVRGRAEIETARAHDTLSNDPSFAEFYKSSPDAVLPKKIGRFEITKSIGSGGFGLVFLAFDPNLGRDVALKIPRPEAIATPELKARFLREGRAAAALAHPNTVPVFESGQIGAICYLASQYVDGETLSDWAARRRSQISPTDAAEICCVIAEALAHAHQRGVIHRDIKPTNILVSKQKDGERIAGRIQITDFGLAKNLADDSEQTQTGSLIGTPAYMSPEQAAQQAATHSSDIYSTGAVLYQLLTGRPPFSSDTIVGTIGAVINDQPKPPRRLNAAVPADLQAICLKCLEKSQQSRYQSSAALRDDLEAWLEGRPVVARPISSFRRFARWTKRNKVVSLLGAAILFVILTGVIWITRERNIAQANFIEADHNFNKAEFARNAATRNLAYAESNLQRSQRVVDSLLEQAGDRLKNVPGAEVARKNILMEVLRFYQEVSQEKSDDPFVMFESAIAHEKVGEILIQLGEYDDARQSLEQAIAELEKLTDEESKTPVQTALPIAYGVLAQALLNQGRPEEAVRPSKKAVELWQVVANDHVPLTLHQKYRRLDCMMTYAIVLDRTGSNDDAGSVYRANLREYRQLNTEAPRNDALKDMAGCLNNLANNLRRLKTPSNENLKEARELNLEAISILESLVVDEPNNASYKDWLSNSIFSLGNATPAGPNRDELINRSLEIKRELNRNFPLIPELAITYSDYLFNIGDRDRKTGKLESAESRFRQAVQVQRDLLVRFPDSGTYHGKLGRILNNLGLVIVKAKRNDEAIEIFAEAIDHQSIAFKQDPKNPKYRIPLGRHYVNLAVAYMKSGEYRSAADVARLIESDLSDDPEFAFVAAQFFGRCYAQAIDDDAMDESSRTKTADDYRQRALSLLSICVRHPGYKNRAAQLSTKAFKGLADDREFQKLIGD